MQRFYYFGNLFETGKIVNFKININLLLNKHKLKRFYDLNKIGNGNKTKQHQSVTFLGCILDDIIASESICYKSKKKIQRMF